MVPSFVELHCGTYRILSPFLLAITRWRRELNPNSPPKRFLCSNSMENCFKGETTVVTWKSRGKWHLQLLTRCCCILKSNRGTVYAPINIPSNPPPPPKKKNVKNVSLMMCLQTKVASCNHNQRRPELPYNAFVQNI